MSYSGYSIGSIIAHSIVAQVQHGRNNVNIWLCQCDCGRMLEVDQNSLLKGIVPACKVCRRGPCVVCEKDITNEEYSVKRNTCSDECFKANRRRISRSSYRKRSDEDPNFNKKHYQAALMRDPDHNKKRYQSKLIKLRAMPENERKTFLKREYDQSNDWTARKRAFLKEHDPAGYAIFLEKRRASYRRFKCQSPKIEE